MKQQDFTFSFTADRSPGEVFKTILDARNWWSGIFSETFEGISNALNEEFTFRAGDGVHCTRQKLVEAVPEKKVTWLVTDSRLSFANPPDEWTGTRFGFELSTSGNKTNVRFTHQGLTPEFECFESCSGGWTQYLQQLARRMSAGTAH